MNSILYHQKIKENRKGQKVYLGEDAYPYADKDILIVADGLGGRGGFPHKKFKKDILDKDKFYDILFDDAFNKDVTDEYKEFVMKSFNELFETSEYYFDEADTVKCSGYFASRIVTAITLYELKFEEAFNKASIFEKVRGASDEERDEVVQKIGDELARRILARLSIIADNAKLELEMKMAGAYLLPSTLTVAITDEQEDCVDVIYLWAGDSRGYVWDKDGLGQITEDHEKDEAMTNIITLTQPFRIEGRFVTVNKPCILFNASDGCYKCPVFASPIDLECIFDNAIKNNPDFDSAMDSLSDTLGQIGRHDDSNTMALSTFGYESYEDVRQAVIQRLEEIENTVVKKLPDIFERDYTYELQRVEEEIDSAISVIEDEVIENSDVAEFVKKDMIDSKYPPFVREMNEASRESDNSEELEKANEKLRKWVAKHWIEYPELKKISSAKDKFVDGKNPFDEYKEYRKVLGEIKDKHTRTVAMALDSLPSAATELEKLLGQMKDIKNVHSKNLTFDCDKMQGILDFVKNALKLNSEETKEYNQILGKVTYLNALYDSYDDEAIKEVMEDILKGRIDLSKISATQYEPLKKILKEYSEVKKNENGLEEIQNKIADKYVKNYWNYKSRSLCKKLWAEHKELIPEKLLTEVSEKIDSLEKKKAELVSGSVLREQIYEEYRKIYVRLYRGSKI